MKTALLSLGALAAIPLTLAAQQPRNEGPAGPGGPGGRPVPPMMAALDTNKDGEIDATELANATASLKTLDKNSDGKLSGDEIRPARGERGSGGGQGGGRGPGGQGGQGAPGGAKP